MTMREIFPVNRPATRTVRRELASGLQVLERVPVRPLATKRTTRTLAPQPERVVKGVIAAEFGWFKDNRGQFNNESLATIVSRMRENDVSTKGTICRFGHTGSGPDELGSYLGRLRNPRMSTTTQPGGQVVRCVRADLHISGAADRSPTFPGVGSYVAELAESDERAVNLSLVIRPKEIPMRGEPAVWMAEAIEGCDIVAVGAATNSLLAA
jgi:hypothetical protein